ncbi:MAG: glycosyltransferase family 4 protein, partial [Tepidisphaeraceae bacterium]
MSAVESTISLQTAAGPRDHVGREPARARVVIATLNRPEGATGVHTHTRSLSAGLRAKGFGCDVVTPFSGSRVWLPIFAVRPLVLNRLNPTWATLWYRSWHQAALRANLHRSLRERPVQQIIAQCPPSARVAMEVLQRLGLRDRVPVAMVCHFNGSEAGEYRDQGVLKGAAFDRVNAEEEQTLRDVDRVIYVSAWARDLVETGRSISTRQSSVVWNG